MKGFYFDFEERTETYIVGLGREISALYDKMENEGFYTVFTEKPIIKEDKYYTLRYFNEGNNFEDGITILNEKRTVELLLSLVDISETEILEIEEEEEF